MVRLVTLLERPGGVGGSIARSNGRSRLFKIYNDREPGLDPWKYPCEAHAAFQGDA